MAYIFLTYSHFLELKKQEMCSKNVTAYNTQWLSAQICSAVGLRLLKINHREKYYTVPALVVESAPNSFLLTEVLGGGSLGLSSTGLGVDVFGVDDKTEPEPRQQLTHE